jgi:hypothetical protein
MSEQVARTLGPAATIEIGGRCGSREALDPRPDWDRNHVLFQPFVVANACVASGGEHIDKAVLGDHLERISG